MRSILQIFTLLLVLPSYVLAQTPEQTQGVASLHGEERSNYIEQVKHLHASQDETEALLLQLNFLLQEHALLAGYQVGMSQPQDYLYSVRIAEPGVLVIRQQIKGEQNQLSVTNEPLPVFGISSFFSYDCERGRVDCLITHGDSGLQLLRVARHPKAAQEITKVLSYLVRSMQRNARTTAVQ